MADFSAVQHVSARQHGVLTLTQLEEAGFTKRKVRHLVTKGILRRLKGGVLAVAGAPNSWHCRLAAAALAAQRIGGAASHRSAARLWQMRSADEDVEVAIPYPLRLLLDSAIVHRSIDLLDIDITWVNGIPVTTPERTLCDLGLIFPEPEVMRMLRHAVASGLVNRRDVRQLRHRIGKPGRDGAGVIGRCLDTLPELAEYAESGLEVMFLEICERHDLPTPAVQVPVVVADRHYRLDFAYPAQRVFIEVDGAAVHSELHQIAADGGRQNDLVVAGWQPVRLTYAMLKNEPDRCAEIIAKVLRF